MAVGRVLTAVFGAVALVALAGGGAYFVFDRVSGSDNGVSVKIVEMINKPYTLGQTTEVLDRPMDAGRSLMRIRQGGSVTIMGIVEGDAWLQVALPKDQVGYIPSATIPGILSDEAPKAAPPPAVASTPAPVQPAVPPAAAAPPDSAPASADDGPEAPPPADLVDFQAVDRQLSVAQATGLYLAPNDRAPQAYTVKPGTQVEIIAVSKDGKWGWVNVSDGTPAYLKLADLNGASAQPNQQ